MSFVLYQMEKTFHFCKWDKSFCMKLRPLIIAFCCSTVLLLAQFTPLSAQCELLGEVVDGSTSGSCGILINAVQDGSTYEPMDGGSGLQPGQVITFSIDSIGATQGCNEATPVVLTCFEIIGDDCTDQNMVDTSAPCTTEYEPVCGCDGQTYANACQAENWHGIIAWTPGPCAGDDPTSCFASFMYVFLDEETVLFFNNAHGYTGYEWHFGDGTTASFGDTMSFTRNIPEGTANVCLKVWNNSGCQDEFCLEVAADAPEEMCNSTACVWPGDTNGDGAANNFDILNLGLGVNTHGVERPFFPNPNNPIEWAPNYGDDWSSWVGPVNFKHLDCNGDGVINDADIEAIHYNYVADFDFESNPEPGSPPISIEFDQSNIVIDESTPPYVEISASIYMGSEALPFIDLHGLAFNINYPSDLVVASSISTGIEDGFLLGSSAEVINFSHDLYNQNIGRYDAALSRRNGPGTSGFGKVARVNFVVNADIIEGLAVPETPFDIAMEQVRMVNSIGENITFGMENNSSTITFINSNVASNDPSDPYHGITIFPNPVTDILYINLDQVKVQQVQIADALGKIVWSQPIGNAQQNLQLRVADYKPGLYLVRFVTEEGFFSKKIIVE